MCEDTFELIASAYCLSSLIMFPAGHHVEVLNILVILSKFGNETPECFRFVCYCSC